MNATPDDARYAKYQRLLFDRPCPGLLRVTMSNGKLNSADAILHNEMTTIWRDIDADRSVTAILLTGAGKVFSIGGDPSMIDALMNDYATRMQGWKEARDIVYGMAECSKPIVSAVRGGAAGAGLVFALMADISIVTKDAKLIDGHTRLGVVPGDHAALIWPLLCGMAKAKYYLLLAETLLGEEAARIGLVSRAVDEEALDATALDVAGRLAAGAPAAIRWTKHTLNHWLRRAAPIFEASLALEFIGFTGPEAREGLAAIRERRPPAFPADIPS